MDKVTNKGILERTGLPSMGDLLIRKNPVDWTPHEYVTRQDTKADSLVSKVTEREGALVFGSRIPSRETRS